MTDPGRNDLCPCGSGRKFKKCCLLSSPPSTAAPIRLAAAHLEAGRWQEADVVLEQVLKSWPQHADALHLSGYAASRLGNLSRAVERIGAAIQRRPDSASYHNSLGIVYGQQRRGAEAMASFRRALTLSPGSPAALGNLAAQLGDAGEFDEAEARYRQLLELTPNAAEANNNLASLLQTQGRLDEAECLFERVLTADPLNPRAHAGRIWNCLYHPASMPGEALRQAQRFAEPHERALSASLSRRDNDPDPDRRLRIGYVSADLRLHSVAFFFEPILAHHDHARFEIFCYSTGLQRDAVTARLEAASDHWIEARDLSDEALASRIRSDRIDVLVDLSGHSIGNRLLVFARKPAPVQCTWIGSVATTGLAAMDYRLTDAVADPVDANTSEHSEELIRLPSCLCFRPPAAAPGVAPLPALAEGRITFGSFNIPAKQNARVLELWADVLRAVPDSRLLLKGRGLDRGVLRHATLERFARVGIAAKRVLLLPYESDDLAHLQRYAQVDVGLDPFPYNGVTTTCLALWMGVPVVALRGDRHSARICASVLSAAGLSDCIADTLADYRNLAVSLASDTRRLALLRTGLRDRVSASALRDELGATRHVEDAYRKAWQRWCRS
jgi:predicted O-linked N-acetylglucosamine transferase (SPINDLY family)